MLRCVYDVSTGGATEQTSADYSERKATTCARAGSAAPKPTCPASGARPSRVRAACTWPWSSRGEPLCCRHEIGECREISGHYQLARPNGRFAASHWGPERLSCASRERGTTQPDALRAGGRPEGQVTGLELRSHQDGTLNAPRAAARRWLGPHPSEAAPHMARFLWGCLHALSGAASLVVSTRCATSVHAARLAASARRTGP